MSIEIEYYGNPRYETMYRIKKSISHARWKHKVFAKDNQEAFNVLLEEIYELHHAMTNESEQRVKEEALDCIAVLARIIENDIVKK